MAEKGADAELCDTGYLDNHERMYPPRAELLESINDFMGAYNERQDAIQKEKASKRHEPDADGFVTVTRGKVGATTQKEEVEKQLERQKEKQKGFGDFYRFQGREKRKEREMEIRRQFKEDQERVRKMREVKGRYEVRLSLLQPVFDILAHVVLHSLNEPSMSAMITRLELSAQVGTTIPQVPLNDERPAAL